ncbi:hypothetical protein [Lysinibacillus endophyticus]|uniref:hypothetical protein n=1 Tax=Ureibacillus endophyticus TaxID=1978490 RepID=UPI003135C62D
MLFPNLPIKTLGGQVFWQTIESKNGWKLQQNIFTEHYRIIDPENIRQAWSTDFNEIRSTFRKFTENQISW